MRRPLEELVDRWRNEADLLQRRNCPRQADLLESCAKELEQALRADERARLSLEEAAEWSGYSRERLRELVRDGQLPDRRPPGARQGTPYEFRRSDLPRHPLAKRDPDAMPFPGRAEAPAPRDRPAERAARRAEDG